jgi:hypothetical protein
MSKITNRHAAPRDGDSAEHRLARAVPHLPPETLHQLIRHRGLDACGELVASATPAQLDALLDLDLWRHPRPGRDQVFDVGRFGEWLEVLVETGDSAAARTVAALDQDLVIAGLSRYVRVLDPGIFEPTAQSDDEPTDRHEAMREGDSIHADDGPLHHSSDQPECELGGYIVRARRADAWDAIVTLLVALDAEHGSSFHALMRGCRRFSNSRSEIDGLDDLLPAPEQHLHDVSIERERRRSQQGHATPADARAFLAMARQPRHPRSGGSATGSIEVNPIVAAYFRAADEAAEPSNEAARSPERRLEAPSPAAPATDVAELEAVVELLREAGVMPPRPRGLLEPAAAAAQASGLARLRQLMEHVRETHETAHFTRSRELAFLANALLAGGTLQSRSFTPQEASDAAAATCNLGLEYWPARWPGLTAPGTTRPPDSWLVDHDLVTAFEVGWSVLHADVSLFAADQLVTTLAPVHGVDPDVRAGLDALRRALVKERDAGTPWRARDAAEVLALLDPTVWIGVLGVLDECPVLPAALAAVLEGRTTSVSPTGFAFISTSAQVEEVRTFMRKLPDLLSG